MSLATLNCPQGRLNGICRVGYDDSGTATTLNKAAMLANSIAFERMGIVDKRESCRKQL
jgi:hypothetical protein